MGCDHNCAACGGCHNPGQMELTAPELEILDQLSQFAFLPVGRKTDDPTPIYLFPDGTPEHSLALQVLEVKGLILLDFDRPLKNFSAEGVLPCPIYGSAALTARGQLVVELVQNQGVSE